MKCSRQFVVLGKCLHGWGLKEMAVRYRFLLIIEGCAVTSFCTNQGRIQDFKLGGGGALKKIRQKIIFFPILWGGAPPLDPPLLMLQNTCCMVLSFSSFVTENHQHTDVYFPAHAW
jgi:hypothetical protein